MIGILLNHIMAEMSLYSFFHMTIKAFGGKPKWKKYDRIPDGTRCHFGHMFGGHVIESFDDAIVVASQYIILDSGYVVYGTALCLDHSLNPFWMSEIVINIPEKQPVMA